MSQARIPRLSEGDAKRAATGAGVHEHMATLSVFQVLLRHPRLAAAVNQLLSALLFDARLDARLRELVIMRVGWLTGSEYEWTQHWRVARSLGVAEADLLAVRDGPSHHAFGPTERAVLAATDETLTLGAITAATWEACRRHLGGDAQTLLELVAAIGTWRMIACVLLSLEVPLEDSVDGWPPDGRTPPPVRQPQGEAL